MGVQVRHETKFHSAAYMAARQKKKLVASGKVDALELGELGVDKMDIDDDKEDDDSDDSMPADDVIGITREIAATLSIAQDRRKGPRPDRPEGKSEKKVRYRAVGRGEKWRDDVCSTTISYYNCMSNFMPDIYHDLSPPSRLHLPYICFTAILEIFGDWQDAKFRTRVLSEW